MLSLTYVLDFSLSYVLNFLLCMPQDWQTIDIQAQKIFQLGIHLQIVYLSRYKIIIFKRHLITKKE